MFSEFIPFTAQASNEDNSFDGDVFRSVGVMAPSPATAFEHNTHAFQNMSLYEPEPAFQPSQKSCDPFDTFKGPSFDAFSAFSVAAPTPTEVELKQAPEWVEKYSSFVSSAEPAELYSQIEMCLKNNAIDFESMPHKFKIKAVVYASPLPTRISIRLYQQGGEILCEFQKRDGCSKANMNTFHKVVEYLGQEVACPCTAQAQTVLPVFELPALPSIDCVSESSIKTARQSVLKHLAEMITTGFADQLKNALAELVEISFSDSACLVDTLDMGVITQLLASEDEDIVRCAALILANTVNTITTNLGGLLDPLFEVLQCPASLVSADTKRHVSCVLAVIAQTHGADFSGSHLRTLARFSCAADDTLRNNINLVNNRLVPIAT